jgi:CubicO group peptidase (beta-lactamase class C family)
VTRENRRSGSLTVIVWIVVASALVVCGGVLGAIAHVWALCVIALVAASAAATLAVHAMASRTARPVQVSWARVVAVQPVVLAAAAVGLLGGLRSNDGGWARFGGLLLAPTALALEASLILAAGNGGDRRR